MSLEQNKYVIEKILDKRILNNKVEYLVKFKNSWEPAENLKVEGNMIKDFEAAYANKFNNIGFGKGFTPIKICGVFYKNGRIFHSIQWKETEELGLVLSIEAYIRCPELVIKFYGTEIQWDNNVEVNNSENGLAKYQTIEERIVELQTIAKVLRAKTKMRKVDKKNPINGFAIGLTPLQILGATYRDDELMFLMEWKHITDYEYITAAEAVRKCPLKVIQFFNKKMIYTVDD